MRRFARSVVVPAVRRLGGRRPDRPRRRGDRGQSRRPRQRSAALSHFDQARKDCLGTARNTTSKIWYTVANGVLSDVYAPTIDTTNVETMQYVVTDGSTFTDLQTRDTTYTVASDPTGMVCTVTTTAKSGRYRLVSTYLTDTDRNSVVVRTRFVPLTSAARNDKVYVRLDATVGGNGGGGTGNGGADTRGHRHLHRLAGPGLVRHRHRDQRGQPRLRGPVLPRAARRPAVPAGQQRLRRYGERRAHPARRLARPDADGHGGQRQRRADGRARPRPRPDRHPRARLRHHAAPGSRGRRVDRCTASWPSLVASY